MTTAAKKGNLFLLQAADKFNSSVYTTIAAMQDTTLSINTTSVDITNKGSSGWQELMGGGGVTSLTLTANGVFTNEASQVIVITGIFGQISATGNVVFGVNPSNNDEFVFNGVTWTFKTSGATGDQTNIQGSLSATLDQMIIDMNASGTGGLIVATYGTDSVDTLTVTFDVIGDAGNLYTLADGVQGGANSTPSAATLTGGMDKNQSWNFKLIDEAGTTYIGKYHIDSFETSGASDAEQTFSIGLSSADVIVHTPA